MSKTISIITPAYNESENLPTFFDRLKSANIDMQWEWLVVDDHSKDATFGVASSLAELDSRIRVLRLSRNEGSHSAIVCGLEHAKGDVCAILAADLQDPPESIPELLEKWVEGSQIVWAVRSARQGEKRSKVLFSRLYYALMQKVLGADVVPATGADFVILDRVVVDALLRFKERNSNVLTLLMWMGFRQESVAYVKEARLHGKSGFTLRKSLKLAKNSITSFTAFPLRLTSYAGFVCAGLGAIYTVYLFLNALWGHPVPGWTSLIVVVLLLGGLQLVMLGVIGEYLWTALDEIRGRPRYLIENTAGPDSSRASKSTLSE